MRMFRQALKRGVLFAMPAFVLFLRLFFRAEYLTGRYFVNDMRGLIWSFRSLWARHILRLAPPLPFPAALSSSITNWRNIEFFAEDINNFQSPGTYFQCSHARIRLGKSVFIGPNVGLITSNHSLHDLSQHQEGKDIEIGAQSWIGMNSVILPGVILGTKTVVAAGSVVTRSFPNGNCVIAGSPAKVIRDLEMSSSDTLEA